MTKNRQISNAVFKYIKDNGFKPMKLCRRDQYFVFDMGKDSVVHFTIKGFRGWIFGMWLGCGSTIFDGKDTVCALQFFAQHKDNIDKFKPSRSYFCVDIPEPEINIDKLSTYAFPEILSMLNHIKHNSIVAYVQDCLEEPHCSNSYFTTYISSKLDTIMSYIKEKYTDVLPIIQHKYKTYMLSKYDIVNHVDFIDKNDEYWKVSPRYTMNIHFNKLFDNDELQDIAEYKLLCKWFKKKLYQYTNVDIECYRPGISRYQY